MSRTAALACSVACEPGAPDGENEDLAVIAGRTVVVLDGVTTRTGTGCIHGTAWFVAALADAICANLRGDAAAALEAAIEHTAARHRGSCDLDDPATPAAAVAIVSFSTESVEYFLLGDTTVVIDGPGGLLAVSDDRINGSARAERITADSLPAGSAEKESALLAMKYAELRERNTAGGYWTASVNPAAAHHGLRGSVPAADVARAAVLTDGAARIVTPFATRTWLEALDLLDDAGPQGLIDEVRRHERADATATRWPRNKISDDATAVFVRTSPSRRESRGPGACG